MTIGHGALITSATIGNRVLIGQGAVIQEGCDIGHNSIIAAGAIVLPGTYVLSCPFLFPYAPCNVCLSSANIVVKAVSLFAKMALSYCSYFSTVLFFIITMTNNISGTLVPEKQLWAGNPAVYIRDVTEAEQAGFIKVCCKSFLTLHSKTIFTFSAFLCTVGNQFSFKHCFDDTYIFVMHIVERGALCGYQQDPRRGIPSLRYRLPSSGEDLSRTIHFQNIFSGFLVVRCELR